MKVFNDNGTKVKVYIKRLEENLWEVSSWDREDSIKVKFEYFGNEFYKHLNKGQHWLGLPEGNMITNRVNTLSYEKYLDIQIGSEFQHELAYNNDDGTPSIDRTRKTTKSVQSKSVQSKSIQSEIQMKKYILIDKDNFKNVIETLKVDDDDKKVVTKVFEKHFNLQAKEDEENRITALINARLNDLENDIGTLPDILKKELVEKIKKELEEKAKEPVAEEVEETEEVEEPVAEEKEEI